MEERGKGMADLCLLQKWHSAVAAERQMEVTGLEDQKFVVGCAQIFLQRDALHAFLVSFLLEADASGLPAKRSHAEGQERSAECGTTPKIGTDTQTGIWVWCTVFLVS